MIASRTLVKVELADSVRYSVANLDSEGEGASVTESVLFRVSPFTNDTVDAREAESVTNLDFKAPIETVLANDAAIDRYAVISRESVTVNVAFAERVLYPFLSIAVVNVAFASSILPNVNALERVVVNVEFAEMVLQ